MKVRNLKDYERYEEGDKLLLPGEDVRVVTFDVNPVGPCVVRLYTRHPGVKEPSSVLVGWCEHAETFDVTVEGQCWVQLEPSGEAWVRHKFRRVANPNPSEGETFTRMEKMGLYVDEIGVALHRQAVLQSIAASREGYVRDAYQRQLEKDLVDMRAQIAALTPPAPKVEDEPAA